MSQSAGGVTTISVSPDIRNQVRALKRGADTYDDLFRRMLEQYDPETVRQEA